MILRNQQLFTLPAGTRATSLTSVGSLLLEIALYQPPVRSLEFSLHTARKTPYSFKCGLPDLSWLLAQGYVETTERQIWTIPIHIPGFGLPCCLWSPLNRFRHNVVCCAKTDQAWGIWDIPLCICGVVEDVAYVMDTCFFPVGFSGGLPKLNIADLEAINWLKTI